MVGQHSYMPSSPDSGDLFLPSLHRYGISKSRNFPEHSFLVHFHLPLQPPAGALFRLHLPVSNLQPPVNS